MNETNLQNIASDGLFHQIALVSVKPLLTTTIIHELRESSDRNIDPEHDPMLCLGSMQFACIYLVLLDLARLLSTAQGCWSRQTSPPVLVSRLRGFTARTSHVELDIYLWCM